MLTFGLPLNDRHNIILPREKAAKTCCLWEGARKFRGGGLLHMRKGRKSSSAPSGEGLGAESATKSVAADVLRKSGISAQAAPEPRTLRANPKRSRGRASREQILAATRQVLSEHGLADLTSTRIASVAGISRSAFYLYFEDVQHVLLELIDEASRPFIQLAADLGMPPIGGETDLAWAGRLVDGYIAAWSRDSRILLYRNLESDRGDQRFMSLRIQTLLPLTQRLLQRLMAARPELVPEEALIEAGMIIAMCGQIAIQRTMPGTRMTDLPQLSLIHVIARMLSNRS